MHAATQIGSVVSFRLHDGERKLDTAYQNFGFDFDERLQKKVPVHSGYL